MHASVYDIAHDDHRRIALLGNALTQLANGPDPALREMACEATSTSGPLRGPATTATPSTTHSTRSAPTARSSHRLTARPWPSAAETNFMHRNNPIDASLPHDCGDRAPPSGV
ncbi:hypothetical protein [Cryptosporangium sp. NPDC048952]|uniref:hypothetical protein n=1 Tax=Cryptosporangium sp. NPDC048952 TaxID=3363961 RepID=UPI00371B9F56